MENIIYGYVRVSSKEQSEERQINAFEKLGINIRDIFIDNHRRKSKLDNENLFKTKK